jgi:hypothetical protein
MRERGLPPGPGSLRALLGKPARTSIADTQVKVKGEPTRSFAEWLPEIDAGLPADRAAALLAAVREQVPPADRIELILRLLAQQPGAHRPLYDFVVAVLQQLRDDALDVFDAGLRRSRRASPPSSSATTSSRSPPSPRCSRRCSRGPR